MSSNSILCLRRTASVSEERRKSNKHQSKLYLLALYNVRDYFVYYLDTMQHANKLPMIKTSRRL